MGDGCQCACHRNPNLRTVHVCACTTTAPPTAPAAGDWLEEAMARYRAQAEAGRRVAKVVLECARGTCPTCGLMLDVERRCPEGCR